MTYIDIDGVLLCMELKRSIGRPKTMPVKPKTRACTKCGNVHPFTTDFFGVNAAKTGTYGLLSRCKKCISDDVREYNKYYRVGLRKEVLTAYGDGVLACVCCHESHYEFLCLDHVNGGGGKERKNGLGSVALMYKLRRLGFPKGEYRTLCCNCHQAYTEHGACPHQSASSVIGSGS